MHLERWLAAVGVAVAFAGTPVLAQESDERPLTGSHGAGVAFFQHEQEDDGDAMDDAGEDEDGESDHTDDDEDDDDDSEDEGDDASWGSDDHESEPSPEDAELEAMRKEIDRLQTEYSLAQARQQNRLMAAELKQAELEARANARRAARQAELEELQAEVERIQAQAGLRDARRQEELSGLFEEAERLGAQSSLIGAQLAQMQAELSQMQAQYEARVGELTAKMAYIETMRAAADKVLTEVSRPENPLIDGTLYVSDRRISLNGPIWYGTADYVCDRIDFFNNQSTTEPIFIVIDDSPGGSVMEGYRIVKSIEASKAPIHVVVKSFAASMAAVITTLAPHSYAYPNAIILHHQMSSGANGNLTQITEQLDMMNEWARRLAEPVARKMGVSNERFTEMMYEKNSDGDWTEFADVAVKYKWVDHIVEEIREDGIIERPQSERMTSFFFFEAEEVDGQGNRFVRLPRLKPFDGYFIYNPDKYFRW